MRNQRTRLPAAVKQISAFLLVTSIIFACVGALSLIEGIAEPTNSRVTLMCGGMGFFIFGIVLAVLAAGFYGLRPWSYAFVKVLVGSWWGFGVTFAFGFNKKVISAEVRRAFGLPPIGEIQNEVKSEKVE